MDEFNEKIRFLAMGGYTVKFSALSDCHDSDMECEVSCGAEKYTGTDALPEIALKQAYNNYMNY